MAKEVSVVEYLGFDGKGGVRRRTIASSAVISKGSFLVLSDPNTAAAHATTPNVACAGIAAQEKKGDGEDYTTTISVLTDCVVDAYASGAIPVGSPVALSNPANYVAIAPDSLTVSGAAIIGYAEETAADNEVIRVRLKL